MKPTLEQFRATRVLKKCVGGGSRFEYTLGDKTLWILIREPGWFDCCVHGDPGDMFTTLDDAEQALYAAEKNVE